MTKNIDPPAAAPPPVDLPPGFHWSLERYHRAIAAGVLTEEDKLELLYGKIIELMPAGSTHEECVSLLAEFFIYRFGREYRYRQEKSIVLPSLVSQPEPDFVVVAKKDYSSQPPRGEEIFLVAEVAKSSLAKDRTVKVQLYAEANLTEYWIVNLVDRQIEVHLEPLAEQRVYGSVRIHGETDTFTSPFAGKVVVAELLPAAAAEEE